MIYVPIKNTKEDFHESNLQRNRRRAQSSGQDHFRGHRHEARVHAHANLRLRYRGYHRRKDGAVVWDERTDDTTIEAVKAALSDAGFTAEEDTQPEVTSNEYGLVVQMPKASFTEDSLDNLHRLIEAKGSLIKRRWM